MPNTDHTTRHPKRVRSKSPEKRQLILDAASELFTANGFDAISMDHVAQQAGVSKQTVYSHFGNKGELFKRCIEFRCPVVDMSATLQNSDSSLRDVLLTIGKQLLKLLLSRDGVNMKRICMNGAERQPEISMLFFNAGPNNLARQLTDFFELKTQSGEISMPNCHFAAWQFITMIQGEYTLRANLGIAGEIDKEELYAYLESCINVLLKAYTNQEPVPE